MQPPSRGVLALVVLPGSPCDYVEVVTKFAPVPAGVMHTTKQGHGQQAEVCVVIWSCSPCHGAVGAELGMIKVSRSGRCFICSVCIVASV